MSTKWHSYMEPPNDSRRVRLRFGDDGERDCDGFWWSHEKAWYMSDGSKRRKNAVHPTHWAEIEEATQ